jgi:glycosyltransferase involved in cell wall biosynthesis
VKGAARVPLRVLQVAPDPAVGSGIGAFALALRTALPELGTDVEPLLVPLEAAYTWREVRAFARAAVAASEGCDAAHVELGGGSVYEFQAARALLAAGDVPVFVTVHDPPRPVWAPFQTGLVRDRRALRVLARTFFAIPAARQERLLLGAAAGIFTLSRQGMAALARPFGDPGPRGCVVPYPVAPRLGGAAAAAAAAPSSPPAPASPAAAPFTVGFYGTWYPGKGLHTLVAALERLAGEEPPVRARLWGEAWKRPGSSAGTSYRESVLRQIEAGPPRDLIELPGFLPDERLGPELRACAAVVLPYELRPGTRALASASAALFDVLSTGTPVVVSDVRALGEFVRDGENGLIVPPGDAEALADALRRLRDDRRLRARLAAGARKSALSRSPRAAAETVAGHYSRCLTGPKRG